MPSRAWNHVCIAATFSVAVFLACIGSVRATADTATPAANEIFDRALAFAREQTYPQYVSFVVTVRTKVKDRWLVEQFESVCRSRDDRVVTYAKPLSTTNKADNPYKFTLKLKGLAYHDSPNIDEPFGLPQISPIYDFGLSKLAPATSSAHAYDVSLLDVELLHSRRTYLLELTPLRDPKVFRLRELWVDAKSFEIVKLATNGAFRSGPATTVEWIVSYAMDRGHWLIESEATPASMLLGGYAPAANTYVPLPGANRYEGVSYSFSSFEFPKSVSDYQFFQRKSSEAIQM